MLEYIVEMFSYPFMQRAFLVGILVSLCASLLGVSLVLKRYSMTVSYTHLDVYKRQEIYRPAFGGKEQSFGVQTPVRVERQCKLSLIHI